ncbi:ATP-grasp domain-containing protein [Fluviispira multicolorata]|uniref:ATP-grasp domain-containing protein n=1 Tax=Fluviispira multicolorata TaxID=2654512 RepID=A0A833JBN1_9BACT|nr:ATP-grasp domain-containing protein [Fluviispira multicolorata]KAB8028145.1 ATP-grasp domain-containing protein [Fluviispira multicolorata]
MSKKYLLLLGADQFLRERAVVAALQNFSGEIISIVKDPRNNRNRYFHHCLQGDPMDPLSSLTAIHSFLEANPGYLLGVVPCNDWTLMSAARIAHKYDLPSLSFETIKLCRNKFAMKEKFLQNDLPIPRFALFCSFEELIEKVKEIGYPLVIKPKDFGGSGGVVKVENAAQLRSAFEHCEKILNQYANVFHVSLGEYVVEEYIQARDEISVEVFAQRNKQTVLAVTDKYLSAEPWFSEIGHVVPSIYSASKKIHEISCLAVQALGIDKGVCHVEMRITDSGDIRLMEVGARPGGDAILDLVERTYGFNPYEFHIAAWQGISIDECKISNKEKGTSAIAFLKAPIGKIKNINLPSYLPNYITALNITAKVGDISEDSICWRAREGIVEFFWKDSVDKGEKLKKHIEIAEALSQEIFQVE